MNREIRVAILGMILGILSTIATEEMRCFFKLSKASKCYQCLMKSATLSDSHDLAIGFMIICLVVAIVPSNDSDHDLVCFFCIGGGGIATLILAIYDIASCF
jgi:hypothetical protein